MPRPTSPREIVPREGGPLDSVAQLTVSDGIVYFLSDPATRGGSADELWRSDGTSAGTFQIAQFAEGDFKTKYHEIVDLDGTLYFSASGIYQTENGAIPTTNILTLWQTDGSVDGEVPLNELNSPIPFGSLLPNLTKIAPFNLEKLDDYLYFFHYDRLDAAGELWRIDGATGALELVGSRPDVITGEWNNKLLGAHIATTDDAIYFTAGHDDIWKGENGASGIEHVISFENIESIKNATIEELFSFGSDLLSVVSIIDSENAIRDWQLWRIDGDSGEAHRLQSFGRDYQGFGAQEVEEVAVTDEYVYFTTSEHWIQQGDDPNAVWRVPGGLWRTDGTRAGTVEIKENIKAESLTALGDQVFFVSDGDASDGDPRAVDSFGNAVNPEDDETDTELWASDGTTAGTRRVKDINLGERASDPEELTAVGDTLIFSAVVGENAPGAWLPNGNERSVWISDGTEAGTFLYAQVEGDPQHFVKLGDDIVFTTGRRLWSIDAPDAVSSSIPVTVEEVTDSLL